MRRAILVLLLLATWVAAAAAGEGEALEGDDVDGGGGVPVLEPSGAGGADDSGPTRQLRFGEKVALDDIGPIIVNEDCTMRRIENWREMTERERRGTQKRIAERNALRLGNCRDRYAKAGIWRDAYSDLGTWKGPSEGFASESEHDEL
jgi:hypothetical protein